MPTATDALDREAALSLVRKLRDHLQGSDIVRRWPAGDPAAALAANVLLSLNYS